MGGDFLVKVEKRSEEFDTTKLKDSLIRAGAKEEHATKVAEAVARTVWEGMPTAEIRRRAATELKRMDHEAARVYETYENPEI